MTKQPRKVPRLSLKQYTAGSDTERKEFSSLLAVGLKEYGFIVLYDHPISEQLLQTSYQQVETLFSLKSSVKNKYSAKGNGGQRGYTAFGVEHAKDAEAVDLKEFWHVGQELSTNHKYHSVYSPNLWPEEMPEFKGNFLKLYQALENTGNIMLEALCFDLGLKNNYFSEMTDAGNSILRLLHYPPIPDGADPRSIRAAAHEDINLITLLVSASASGLQLKDRDGKWLDVESEKGDIIVDSGDMLARATNEVYPATTHRVVNPEDASTSRYSMPFFMHPHSEAVLSCIESCRGDGAKYPDISSHDFLMQRLKEIGLI
jgi:isopenicillin N synthase-like dioxygenase